MMATPEPSTTTNPPSTSPPNRTLQVHHTAHLSDKAHPIPDPHAEHFISINAQSVLHPHSRIDATAGPSSLGEACTLHARAALGVPPPPGSAKDAAAARGTILGAGGTLAPHAVVCAGAVLGARVRVGAGAVVGANAALGDGVVVAPRARVPPGMDVPAGAVVVGDGRVVRTREVVDWAAGERLEDADMQRAEELREMGEMRHRALMRKLVRGQAGGTGKLV